MGTVETRSSKTLASLPESDQIEPPNEKTLDLTDEFSTEKRDDSVAVVEGQVNGFSDSGEANVTEKDEENGVSLSENENKPENEDDGNGFSVGDFVWGKIKSHPWWPGQIYDPVNVSELAAKIKNHKRRHLVAYFGDGTFAWCESSQLRPFEESFGEMSKQSVAKGFVAAVQQALDEIGRVLESETTCPCVPERSKLRSVAENAGVREGSLVPEGKIRRFSDILAEPSELLSALKRVARRRSSSGVVELGVLTSRVSSFYRSKGVLKLPHYRDPVSVLGLEDKSKSGPEIRAQGPSEEDWVSQPDQPLLRSCPSSSENKRNPRRKQRSIADLIATEGTSSEKKKIKRGDDHLKLLFSAAKARKKTRLPSGSRIINIADKDDGDSAVEKTLEKSSSYREKKKSKYLSPPFMIDANGGEKRKKDAETELPIVVLVDEDRNRGGGIVYHQKKKADVFTTNEFLSEVRSTAADPFSRRGKKSAEMVSGFISVYRDSVYSDGAEKMPWPHKRKRKNSESETPETNLSSAAGKSNEKRVETRGRKKKLVTETPEANTIGKSPESYISSADANKSGEKRVETRGRKKKQVTETPEVKKKKRTPNQPVDKSNENKKVETHGRKKKKQVIKIPRTAREEEATKSRGRKKKKPESETPVTKNKETIDEKTLPATLIVEFAPASILPSKADLIEMYEKYGDLDKAKTDMYYANQCARVYFLNGSEAQIAYAESKKESPFGSNSVEFVLECPSREYKTRMLQEITSGKKKKKKTPKKALKGKAGSELGFMKSKLETISSMLDEKEGKMSPTMKSKLKGEILGLLEKVSAMVVGSSSA